jgi:hypothetical protein
LLGRAPSVWYLQFGLHLWQALPFCSKPLKAVVSTWWANPILHPWAGSSYRRPSTARRPRAAWTVGCNGPAQMR